ncbi:toll/interleukin-1 receptor domain-containing protein [Planctomycetota bacterium]
MCNVFLSWSGRRSRQVAQALYDWLPRIVNSIKPWFSPEDIDKGDIWFGNIAEQLEKIDIGIVCLTPENLHEDWLLFEAGGILASVGQKKKVLTYLYDVKPSDIGDPLAQLNHTFANKEDTLRMLNTLSRLLDQNHNDDNLAYLFEKCWDDVDASFKSIPSQTTTEIEKVKLLDPEDKTNEMLSLLRRLSQTTSIARPVNRFKMEELFEGWPDADELMKRYCSKVYAEVGSYQEGARVLNIDRRTFKSKVDPDLIEE